MDILSIKNLTFGYKDCPVFEDFSISFEEGKIHCVVGENGAGKTTLLKCISSLINNSKDVYYKGNSIEKDKSLLQSISYIMSEDTLYPHMTVNENIKFYSSLFSKTKKFKDKVHYLLNKLGCDEYADSLVKSLSQGTRNKIYLSIMLSKDAEVFLLDEPFTALDSQSQKFFFDLIKEKNKNENSTFIIVTHIEEFKKIASNTIEIKKLKIAD